MDDVEIFRKVFDNSEIVRRWEEKGFDHVGTIFCGDEYDITFPMDGGIEITKSTRMRTITFDLDMLNLIHDTKDYIIKLDAVVEALYDRQE